MGYILFPMSEGWVRVWVIVAFSPKSKSWRTHEHFCGVSTLLGSPARLTCLIRGWWLYWGGQNPPIDLFPFRELGRWPGLSSTSKAITWQSDSLHALQGCKDRIRTLWLDCSGPGEIGTRTGWNTEHYWMSIAPLVQPSWSAEERTR